MAVGEGVTDFAVGDRVAYTGPIGAYADERLLPADKRGRSARRRSATRCRGASMLKGGTAYYLLLETWPLKAGETVLVHAAAGGVGSLLAQWGSALGATVIGTAGSDEKVERALAERLRRTRSTTDSRDWPQKVREATGGRGVDVVYDGVGKATFEGSLDCLRPRGMLVSYGSASGAVTIPNLGILASKGSLYVTRPTMGHYLATPEATAPGDGRPCSRLMRRARSGSRSASASPLDKAAEAHRALEARETTGMTLLIP